MGWRRGHANKCDGTLVWRGARRVRAALPHSFSEDIGLIQHLVEMHIIGRRSGTLSGNLEPLWEFIRAAGGLEDEQVVAATGAQEHKEQDEVCLSRLSSSWAPCRRQPCLCSVLGAEEGVLDAAGLLQALCKHRSHECAHRDVDGSCQLVSALRSD